MRRSLRTRILPCIVYSLCFMPGCALTTRWMNPPKSPPETYQGVKLDVDMMSAPFHAEGWDAETRAMGPLMFLCGLVDLPFSMVIDTLFLPFEMNGREPRDPAASQDPPMQHDASCPAPGQATEAIQSN